MTRFATVLYVALLITLLFTPPATTHAASKKSKIASAETSSTAVAPSLPEDPTPFGFVLGVTTSAQAQEIWDEEDGEITSTGYGLANPTSEDNDPEGVINKFVTLFDVKELPMEQLDSARFAFLNDKLFLIRYSLEGDLERMALQLVAKYGEPNGYSGDFGDDTLSWHFKSITVRLNKDYPNRDLLFIHEGLAEEANVLNRKIYTEFIRAKAQAERGF